MGIQEDEPARKRLTRHLLGEDLSELSAHELQERIDDLAAEVDRLKAELATKGTTRDAAEAFFRKR